MNKTKDNKRKLYFIRQKIIGAFLLAFTVFSVYLLDGEATIAIITVPIGLGMIFSRNICWMGDGYFKR